MEVTIGEIEEKLNKTIFQERCVYFERENILKEYIDLCSQICVQLATLPEENNKITFYKDQRVKRSLRRLCDYIAYLVNELNKDKIIYFCDNQRLLINYDIDLTFIFANSYYGNIKNDLYWISDITIHEALHLSTGHFKVEKLGEKLPSAYLKFKKEVLPFFINDKLFFEFSLIFKEIDSSYKHKNFCACNLLLLTSIEGIVRKLGNYLIDKQSLKVPDSSKLNSLDSFLRNVDWKEDYEISQTAYLLLSGDIEYRRNREPFKNININLKYRLDFLRRRFKEDRDLILHGLENDYGKSWNLFVNFSALDHVYETCKYYRKLYEY